MTLDLGGKVAIVTGAGTGIGWEIVRQLLKAGASVLMNEVREDILSDAYDRLGKPDQCIPVLGDAGSIKCIDDLIKKALEAFGRLDIAIANAGITSYGKFLECSETQFDELIHLNLKGSYFLAQKSARQMLQQGNGGRIILMSSVTGVLAHPLLAAYGMTKAGISHLVRCLVPELANTGITVNAIAPGAVATERTMQMDPHYDQNWSQYIPTGRVSYPGDIAQAVLFLASSYARQINGQTLVIDGGITSLCVIPPEGN